MQLLVDLVLQICHCQHKIDYPIFKNVLNTEIDFFYLLMQHQTSKWILFTWNCTCELLRERTRYMQGRKSTCFQVVCYKTWHWIYSNLLWAIVCLFFFEEVAEALMPSFHQPFFSYFNYFFNDKIFVLKNMVANFFVK